MKVIISEKKSEEGVPFVREEDMTEVVGVVTEFTAELFEINQVSLLRNRKLVLNFDSMSTINWVWDFLGQILGV